MTVTGRALSGSNLNPTDPWLPDELRPNRAYLFYLAFNISGLQHQWAQNHGNSSQVCFLKRLDEDSNENIVDDRATSSSQAHSLPIPARLYASHMRSNNPSEQYGGPRLIKRMAHSPFRSTILFLSFSHLIYHNRRNSRCISHLCCRSFS